MTNPRPRTSRVQRIGPALPSDPLDRDLESIPSLRQLSGKGTLWWGLAVPLAAEINAANPVTVPGEDWLIVFYPTGRLELRSFSERVFGKTGSRKFVKRKIRRPAAFLKVNTGTQRLNEAREYGRPAVRTLLGLARMKFPIILAHETIWEGAIQPRGRSGDRLRERYTAVHSGVEAPPADPRYVTDTGLGLAPFKLRTLPQHVGLSLRWYGLAWASRRRADQFIQLWLSALVLIDHGYTKTQRKKISQDSRIDRYVNGMLLSTSRAQQLADTLKAAYDRRNTMIHEGDESAATEEAVEQLQAAVMQMLSFELAQARSRT
jgi:hypothetical protein